MTTVLDTIPEFEGSAEAARQKLNNFTLEAMIEMFAADLERSDRRFLVVRYEGELIAHSILSVRGAGSQKAWGYFFTRYVLPEHRRRGVGGLLLDAGIEWFQAAGCRVAAKSRRRPTSRTRGCCVSSPRADFRSWSASSAPGLMCACASSSPSEPGARGSVAPEEAPPAKPRSTRRRRRVHHHRHLEPPRTPEGLVVHQLGHESGDVGARGGLPGEEPGDRRWEHVVG